MEKTKKGKPLLLKLIIKLLQGALIGLGSVLPGISGGVLSVVFGVYKPVMELLADPVGKAKTHLPRLLPYFAGAVIGFLGVAFSYSKRYRNRERIKFRFMMCQKL